MLALLMFCCQCGSRRKLDAEMVSREFVLNFQTLLGDDEAAATSADNMNHALERVGPRELEKLAVRFTKALNRKKVLRKFKCDGMLVVAVDGTQMKTFKERHCPNCLTRELSNGNVQSYHYVLAAKIVTPVGLILPAAFEFVENPSGKFDKQERQTRTSHAGACRHPAKNNQQPETRNQKLRQELIPQRCRKRPRVWQLTLKRL